MRATELCAIVMVASSAIEMWIDANYQVADMINAIHRTADAEHPSVRFWDRAADALPPMPDMDMAGDALRVSGSDYVNGRLWGVATMSALSLTRTWCPGRGTAGGARYGRLPLYIYGDHHIGPREEMP